MAKAKRKYTKRTVTKGSKVDLPEGFKEIRAGGKDSWHPTDPGEAITGVMGAVGVVTFPAKGKREAQDVPEYTIQTKDGSVRVLESAGLRALGKVKKGRQVFIKFLGLKQIKAGQAPMRDFLVATK